jgi:hypothetical protein
MRPQKTAAVPIRDSCRFALAACRSVLCKRRGCPYWKGHSGSRTPDGRARIRENGSGVFGTEWCEMRFGRAQGGESGTLDVCFCTPDGATALLWRKRVRVSSPWMLNHNAHNGDASRPPSARQQPVHARAVPPHAARVHYAPSPCAASNDDNSADKRTGFVLNDTRSER